MDDISKTTKKDIGHAAVRAALGSIPVLGAAATELFGLIITPPLDKRRQQWMNDVADRLKELENSDKLDFVDLAKNEQFIDTVLQATSFALKTSEAEKIAAFKNAVINTALDEAPEKSKSLVFLNLIDRFSVWHIKILSFFDSPLQWFTNAKRTPPSMMIGSMSHVLFDAFPGLEDQKEFVRVIWSDLQAAGFHRSGDLNTTMTPEGTMASRTTELGKEFLAFISEHR